MHQLVAVVPRTEIAVYQASPTKRVTFPKGLMMAPLLYICSKQGPVQSLLNLVNAEGPSEWEDNWLSQDIHAT